MHYNWHPLAPNVPASRGKSAKSASPENIRASLAEACTYSVTTYLQRYQSIFAVFAGLLERGKYKRGQNLGTPFCLAKMLSGQRIGGRSVQTGTQRRSP
jgi:hypothetical protein